MKKNLLLVATAALLSLPSIPSALAQHVYVQVEPSTRPRRAPRSRVLIRLVLACRLSSLGRPRSCLDPRRMDLSASSARRLG